MTKEFITGLKPIIDRNRYVTEERKSRGDFFNIFSILGMETLEVKTHSALITELLNPNGNHGLDKKFLLEFINIVLPITERFTLDNETITIIPEYNIGKIKNEGNEGGQIDIYIETASNIIIIENKINAKDQKTQLIRYYNYGKQKNKPFVLLYLTLDGIPANEQSTEGKDLNGDIITLKPISSYDEKDGQYYTISYKEDIRNWLERCLEISVNHSMVRETIKQYIELIKKITNTENNMGKELKDYLLDNSNLEYTVQLLDLINEDLKSKVMEPIVDSIIERLSQQYKTGWGKILGNDGTFRIYPEVWPVNERNNSLPYFPFCFHANGELYIEQYGITKDSYKLFNEIISKKNNVKTDNLNYVLKEKIDGQTIFGRTKITNGKEFKIRISKETQDTIIKYIKEMISFINDNQDFLTNINVCNELYFGYRNLAQILKPIKELSKYE